MAHSHGQNSSRQPVDRLAVGAAQRSDFCIAANTSSSGTVANVVAVVGRSVGNNKLAGMHKTAAGVDHVGDVAFAFRPLGAISGSRRRPITLA